MLSFETEWRRAELRTNLWLVPTAEVLTAIVLFVGTVMLDRALSPAVNDTFTATARAGSGSSGRSRRSGRPGAGCPR